MRRLRTLYAALPGIAVGIVITTAVVVAHNDGVARDRQNARSAVVACNSAYDSSSTIVRAVGIAIVRPGPKHDAEVRFVTDLQAAIDKDHTRCLNSTR